MNINKNKKGKRTKLVCPRCGSKFDNDDKWYNLFKICEILWNLKNLKILKILTESFKAKILNIIDDIMLLNSFTDILNNINEDNLTLDNLVKSSIKYAKWN